MSFPDWIPHQQEVVEHGHTVLWGDPELGDDWQSMGLGDFFWDECDLVELWSHECDCDGEDLMRDDISHRAEYELWFDGIKFGTTVLYVPHDLYRPYISVDSWELDNDAMARIKRMELPADEPCPRDRTRLGYVTSEANWFSIEHRKWAVGTSHRKDRNWRAVKRYLRKATRARGKDAVRYELAVS